MLRPNYVGVFHQQFSNFGSCSIYDTRISLPLKRMRLKGCVHNLVVLVVYAPILGADTATKDFFYMDIEPRSDFLIIIILANRPTHFDIARLKRVSGEDLLVALQNRFMGLRETDAQDPDHSRQSSQHAP